MNSSGAHYLLIKTILMNKIFKQPCTFFIFSFCLLWSYASTAQSKITKGLIKMEISDVDSEDQAIATQLEMMKGTETDYYFNDDQSLVTANMMGGMVKMQSLTKNSNEDLTFLFDMMGQKMMVSSTKEEREKFGGNDKAELSDMKVNYDENDTKNILGFKCIKATIKGNENSPVAFDMYVSEDIKISSKLIQGLQDFEIRGFPLEYTMQMEQLSMTYLVTEIIKELDPTVFELDKTGYEKLTFEEFQEKMKGFGGGMGF